MEDLQDPTIADLNERIQQAEVRGDATSMIALVMQRQELLDSQRETAETDDQAYADPLAAAVAARCGVLRDDEPPQEQRDPRSTREIAASLMRASTAGHTPDPDDDKELDQPDSLTVTVAERLRRKDNAGASNLGVLPRQSKE